MPELPYASDERLTTTRAHFGLPLRALHAKAAALEAEEPAACPVANPNT
jgi:hypothetical protein